VFKMGVAPVSPCRASSVPGSVVKQAPRRLFASTSCAPSCRVKQATPVGSFSSSALSTQAPSPPASSLKDKLVGALAGGVLVALASIIAAYPALTSMWEDNQSLAVANIQQARISELSVEFVARPALQRAVENAIKNPHRNIYTVVYGPKGAGKSTLVEGCASKRSGVVKVAVTQAQSRGDVIDTINEAILGARKVKADSKLSEVAFLNAIKSCNPRPIIIFDVERGGSPDQELGLAAVRSLAKTFAQECAVLIVLSEANAVIHFGADDAREKFIFVNEMTSNEVSELIQKRMQLNAHDGTNLKGDAFTPAEIAHIVNTVGGNPATIEKLLSNVKLGPDDDQRIPLQQALDGIVKKARADLGTFPYPSLLKTLKAHPDGVSRESLEGIEDIAQLWIPRDVATGMKASNAVVYRHELERYELMSTAHKTALKMFTPRPLGKL
jgi:energy-coupling factor transporter ATP-binding protein EcfA2